MERTREGAAVACYCIAWALSQSQGIIVSHSVRAAGPDKITPELLKTAEIPISIALHELFLRIWGSGKVPADWKEVVIISLYKGKGPRTVCSNHRPISPLSVPGKVFAHVLLERLQPLFHPSTETYIYTVFQKKLVHQTHIDNLVNSQRIFIIPSLAHSPENLRYIYHHRFHHTQSVSLHYLVKYKLSNIARTEAR